jgi:hypothetical protein
MVSPKSSLADANGEILMDSNLPCKTCPWRVDQDSSVIPRYDQEKACRLLNSVGDGDAFRPIMACHNSTDTDTIACKGYLAKEGWSNINVRLLLRTGEIENPSEVLQTCMAHGIELEPDYPTVLAKLSASNIE